MHCTVVPVVRGEPGTGKEAQRKDSWDPRKEISADFPDEGLFKETHFPFQKAGLEAPVNSKVEYFREDEPLTNYVTLANCLISLKFSFPFLFLPTP